MKFFTPELLARYGSEDDRVADAAHEDWERATEQYRQHLSQIQPKLPRAVKSLSKRFCLHDARLKMLAIGKDNHSVSMFLELGDTGVLLFYELLSPPRMTKHAFLVEPGSPIEWLYDEFDVKQDGGQRVCTHTILLTGGRELELTFKTLRLEVFEKVVLPPTEVAEDELDALAVS
jgi:hypothetical protein